MIEASNYSRSRRVGASIAVLAWLVAAAAAAAPSRPSEQAFEKLASLQGEWEGEHDGDKVKLTYTLTANGSALMEQFRPANGAVMITIFTVDGDRLLATHYCSAKNQPHMVTEPITDVQKPLVFSLARVTGLKSPDDWHNTGLVVLREDDNHMTQEWTYLSKGKTGKAIFRYGRVLNGANS